MRNYFCLLLCFFVCSCSLDNDFDKQKDETIKDSNLINFNSEEVLPNLNFSVVNQNKSINTSSSKDAELSVTILPIVSEYITRGSFTTTSSINSMGVYCFHTNNVSFNANASTGSLPNYGVNKHITKNQTSWSYTPPIYWPANVGDSLSFFSYSPYKTVQNGIEPSASNVKGTPNLTYTMPTLVTNQPDLLIASPILNKTRSHGIVSFQYKHALASIGFSLKGSNEKVKSIGIKGISTAATVSMDGSNISWSNLNSVSTTASLAGIKYDVSQSYVTATAQKIEAVDLMNSDGYLMVIPQTLTSNAKLVITFSDDTFKEVALDTATPSWAAGHKYIFNINIQGDLIIDDANTSNCYNFNCNSTRNVVYKFPAVTRVNQFWATAANGGYLSQDGDGYIALGNVETNAILDDVTEWYGYIIWADFSDYTKVSIKQQNVSGSYGVGRNEKMQVTFAKGSYSGNIVIGLKKKGGTNCLWSWHFWINPEGTVIQNITLPDGNTVMDRNLGATSTVAGNVKTIGLQYQWGRKDPFLGAALYSSTTSIASPVFGSINTSSANAGTLLLSVYNPNTKYISSTATHRDCINTGHLSGANGCNRWGGSTSNSDLTPMRNNKTIFDPCPNGYRIPSTDATGNFSGLTASHITWSATNFGSTINTSSNFLGAVGSLAYSTGNMANVGTQSFYFSGATKLITGTPNYYVGSSFWILGGSPPTVQTYRAVIRAGGAAVRPAL